VLVGTQLLLGVEELEYQIVVVVLLLVAIQYFMLHQSVVVPAETPISRGMDFQAVQVVVVLVMDEGLVVVQELQGRGLLVVILIPHHHTLVVVVVVLVLLVPIDLAQTQV
jgi:hypothetical protein